jgi:hypothetical protein
MLQGRRILQDEPPDRIVRQQVVIGEKATSNCAHQAGAGKLIRSKHGALAVRAERVYC